MPIMQPRRPARMAITLIAATGLLAGCAQGPLSSREGRIGPDDGADTCRPQLVALDSTGNFFGAQILTGAATGAAAGALAGGIFGRDLKGVLIGAVAGAALGAAGGYWVALQQQSRDQAGMITQVGGDLARENAQIDRTQIAFDQLKDCRYGQAQQIQADYRGKRIDRTVAVARMNAVKQSAQRDLALAKQINTQINGRAQEFEVAADNVSPGTKSAIVASAVAPRRTQLSQPVKLKLSPDANAPDVAALNARDRVTVTGVRNGYAVIETASGQRGYAPASAIEGGAPRSAATSASATGAANADEVRTLAGSNAARRDSFAQSISVSETTIVSGFELAG